MFFPSLEIITFFQHGNRIPSCPSGEPESAGPSPSTLSLSPQPRFHNPLSRTKTFRCRVKGQEREGSEVQPTKKLP